MVNRFSLPSLSIRQKRWGVGIGGCVFGLLLCAMQAQAAMMAGVLIANGDVLAGGSDLTWIISNGNLSDVPPMICGQEVVAISSSDSMLVTGGGTYESKFTVQNGDLILTGTERSLTATGPSSYEESLLYDAAGMGAPEGGCGNTGDLAEGVENITPLVEPYCSMVLVGSGLMGSGLQYQSEGLIGVGSPVDPDAYHFAFLGTGNGYGTAAISSASMTGSGGPGTIGYENAVSQRITAFGKPFRIGASVDWTSFAKTFDAPQEAAE